MLWLTLGFVAFICNIGAANEILLKCDLEETDDWPCLIHTRSII